MTLAALLTLPGWLPAQAEEAQAKPESTPKLERCEAPTGSRISPQRDDKGECPKVAGAGRVYDQEDLQSTGETDLGRALSRLDTSIRSNGY
ncbi:hypothetical protein ED208_03955 [Stagnimonas aquatica]|uniref:Uncharacterized protein n=2 Tax=Stagnimonas aquatica TaxID=2689987 RepID=A0A3N0VLR6_9GAMM|nr:hypothetical protein ED208_03955 [Stagnimonas aquatica]